MDFQSLPNKVKSQLLNHLYKEKNLIWNRQQQMILKKIPIPLFSVKSIVALSNLGKELIDRKKKHNQTIKEIDKIILETLGFEDNYNDKLNSLSNLRMRMLKERTFKIKTTI